MTVMQPIAEDERAQEKRRVASLPTNRTQLYITQVEKLLREAQSERVMIEADHALQREDYRNVLAREKATLNSSIQELEKQLSDLRIRWGRLCDDGEDHLKKMDKELERQLEAQERIISAHRAMLQTLTS